MSEKENAKIELIEKKVDKLETKVEQIYTAISGDELGNIGIVKMLQNHIDQSQKNNEETKKMFKEFKREIGYEYANSFNAVDLSVNHNKQDIDYISGRVKVLEESDKLSAKRHGYFTGVWIVIGAAIGALISFLK